MSDEVKKGNETRHQHIDEGVNKSLPTTNTSTPMPVVKPPRDSGNSSTTNNNNSPKK